MYYSYIIVPLQLHYSNITVTLHLHYISITFPLHFHYVSITFPLRFHYVYITFLLRLHYIYITFTLHLHYIYITFTLHLHYIKTGSIKVDILGTDPYFEVATCKQSESPSVDRRFRIPTCPLDYRFWCSIHPTRDNHCPTLCNFHIFWSLLDRRRFS